MKRPVSRSRTSAPGYWRSSVSISNTLLCSLSTEYRIAENVVSAAGTTHRTTTDELVHLIKAVGKIPVQRDTLYREVKVFA